MEKKEIHIEYLRTEPTIVDILTKSLAKTKHDKCISRVKTMKKYYSIHIDRGDVRVSLAR